ncbi:hypothetical protein PG993_006835 [Apiospora rasikravindrae]|uniref:Uncharacterized protein n=1 Tax=Apiospora rasikravindrae TaxID=990691 RepID=A0ABR1T6U8_9PEZI
MAVRRYALLALAGAALAQMDDMPMASAAPAGGASSMPAEAMPSSMPAAPTGEAASPPMSSMPITAPTPSSGMGMDSGSAMPTGMSASMPYEEPMTMTTTPSSMSMQSSHTTAMASSMTTMSTMTSAHPTSMAGMPMGTGGMMPNGTHGGKEPPISAAGATGVSIGLFIASVLVSAAML